VRILHTGRIRRSHIDNLRRWANAGARFQLCQSPFQFFDAFKQGTFMFCAGLG
jgi:hypothetical protein